MPTLAAEYQDAHITYCLYLPSTAEDIGAVFDHLKSRLTAIENGRDAHIKEFHQFKDQVLHELTSLRDDLSGPNVAHVCGGTGWRCVAYLDMSDPNTTCPSGWNMTGYPKRTCGRASSGWYTQDSVGFPVGGGQYSRVCGRIKAYQWGAATAFGLAFEQDINGSYVTGVSVTHGSDREHIWTFAAGFNEADSAGIVCPCSANIATMPPDFVSGDYFCESGFNTRQGLTNMLSLGTDDPLWDGQNCSSTSSCCNHYPYFIKCLATPTSEDIEVRILNVYPSPNSAVAFQGKSDIAVEQIELYVQ